eukprot:SAG11_NODE_450_length_9391_cov_16.666272_2_plen_84_part_00
MTADPSRSVDQYNVHAKTRNTAVNRKPLNSAHFHQKVRGKLKIDWKLRPPFNVSVNGVSSFIFDLYNILYRSHVCISTGWPVC